MNYPQKAAEEIRKLYPYRLELHAHTSPASHCAELSNEEVLTIFKNDGYHGIGITNHFSCQQDENIEKYSEFYRAELLKVLELGDKIGIKVYAGAELRFISENDNDYLLYGYDPNDIYYICQILRRGTLEDFVKNYKTDDMLLVQAHPFRKGMVCEYDRLLDGYEVFNMHPNHNSRVAVAVQYANELEKIKTMGTDFHHPNHDNLCATRAAFLPENEKELIKLIKSEDVVFEIGDKILI